MTPHICSLTWILIRKDLNRDWLCAVDYLPALWWPSVPLGALRRWISIWTRDHIGLGLAQTPTPRVCVIYPVIFKCPTIYQKLASCYFVPDMILHIRSCVCALGNGYSSVWVLCQMTQSLWFMGPLKVAFPPYMDGCMVNGESLNLLTYNEWWLMFYRLQSLTFLNI